jgi:ACS family allantoate permease-like MFS transporter
VAAVLGMKDDVHMTGNQYNWLGSMFYLGYLVCQVRKKKKKKKKL